MTRELYSDEAILKAMREVDGSNQPPSQESFNNTEGAPCVETVRNRFGSWDKALRRAGYEPAAEFEYSDEELLDWIRAWVSEFGVVPRMKDVHSWPGPATGTYQARFGSWRNAIREAGFEPPD